MSKTKTTRISIEMDRELERMAERLTNSMGRPISKTEASRIIAAHSSAQNIIVVKKGKNKKEPLGLGSRIIHI